MGLGGRHNLLALDQSSKITGWAIFQDDKLIKYGHFEITADNIGERLHRIREKVSELIMDYDIDELAFEDIYMDGQKINNVSTFKILAEVFGVIWELAIALKLPHTAVLAGTWKSTLNIKGKTRPEQKRNAQEFVINTYGVKPTQDECDAICIGKHILLTKNNELNWD